MLHTRIAKLGGIALPIYNMRLFYIIRRNINYSSEFIIIFVHYNVLLLLLKQQLFIFENPSICKTRPDTRPSVADGWAGAEMRVLPVFDLTDKASYRVACPQLKIKQTSRVYY